VEVFNVPPERHWQIVVTKLADKKLGYAAVRQ
jgi:hypothetical protein